MHFLSLKIRILILIIVTSGILVSGMLATVYRLMVSDYIDLVAERESAKIRLLASELALNQEKRLLSLEAFAIRLIDDQGNLLNVLELESILMRSSSASNLFPGGLIVFDANATAIAENQFAENRIGTNYQDRPHFIAAKQSKKSVISQPILGRVTGLPLLSYVYPLLSFDGEIAGYLGGTIDLSKTPLLAEGSIEEDESNTTSIVIDPKNRLFVSMQELFTEPRPLPPAGSDSLVDAAVAMSPAGTRIKYQQTTYLIAAELLNDLGWVVLSAIPYSQAIAPAIESYQRFLLISVLALFFVAAAGAWAANSLTLPIATMTRRINSMADNDRFDGDLDERGGPEVTALAKAMNRLANERNASEAAIRKAERFLTNVLEAASEVAIIATNSNGLITIFNKGAEKMLGYSKSDMVNKQSLAALHLEKEVTARSTVLSEELGKAVTGFRVFVEKAEINGSEIREWTYVNKNGNHIPVSLVVTTMHDDQGKISGYLGIAENITQRKRMERMKDEFISTVSHELRTPLTSISGALGLVLGGAFGQFPEKINNLLLTAQRNSKRLTLLINDLLDIEKIASGNLHFDMQVQLLMPLLHQSIESMQSYGSTRGISLTLLGLETDVLIRVDSQRLMQVLANLLSNAIKFSPDNQTVTLQATTKDNKVIVSVLDNGPGISDKFKSRIFQRFAQADSSDSRAKDGTGLGLAITQELIERMGGRVDFESTIGQGSRFYFELPVVIASAKKAQGELSQAGDVSELKWQTESVDQHHLLNIVNQQLLLPQPERPLKVLHVEDDADLHAIIKAMAGEHFDFEVADTLHDARTRLEHSIFDVILIDIMLPDGSGWDLVSEVRACLPNARVVILSAADMSSQQQTRVDAVLLKSRLTTELLEAGLGTQPSPKADSE